MKLVFMGTPDFAVPVLEALCQHHDVVCVYTRAPKEAGRGQKETKTPVHLFAEKKGIEVRTPKSLRLEEEQRKFKALQADAAIVAAYGLILPRPILEAFPKGCLNVHASLLPRWRGAAPIQRALEAGDEKSGVTIMQMDEGLDTGDMLLKGEVQITPDMTGGDLHDALSGIGADLIIKALDNLENIKPEKQDDAKSCYAQKIEKAECRLNFAETAENIERKVRAFNPYPATFFEYKGERFKVLECEALDADSGMEAGTIVPNDSGLLIQCKKGMLFVVNIQRQGKKAMNIDELLRGFSFEDGVILS